MKGQRDRHGLCRQRRYHLQGGEGATPPPGCWPEYDVLPASSIELTHLSIPTSSSTSRDTCASVATNFTAAGVSTSPHSLLAAVVASLSLCSHRFTPQCRQRSGSPGRVGDIGIKSVAPIPLLPFMESFRHSAAALMQAEFLDTTAQPTTSRGAVVIQQHIHAFTVY